MGAPQTIDQSHLYGGAVRYATAAGATATLTFTGTLQSADKVDGPYADVNGATSPRDVLFSTNAAKFYRTKQ